MLCLNRKAFTQACVKTANYSGRSYFSTLAVQSDGDAPSHERRNIEPAAGVTEKYVRYRK